MVKARAYAASQVIATRLRAVGEPRSTWNHWFAAKALDQRVDASPSTATPVGVPSHSTDDAVTGLPCDTTVSAASAGPTAATRYAASRPRRPAVRATNLAGDGSRRVPPPRNG